MSEFYHYNKDLFVDNNIFVDKNVTMGGCFKSNKETLQRTMVPDIICPTSGLPTFGKIMKFSSSIKSAIRKLKIRRLAKCSIEDLDFVSYSKKTYPGFTYKEYFDFETKEKAASAALSVAKLRWKKISDCAKIGKKLKRNKIFPNTFVVGARNKREYFYEDDEVLTSRAIHMPEFHNEICSSVWIDQISNEIKRKSKGPIYIGNSFVKYERLFKDTFDCGDIVEGDWKKFDSRLYITNIIIGLSILRLYYDLDDKEIDYHFLAIFDTIGIKDYITPGGHLYRMVHGLPSGVCSTSVLGSIINLVNLLYCTQDFNSKRINFIIGGDDFLVAPKRELDIKNLLELMIKRSEEIGQIFKILEFKNFKNSNILKRPSFYKYTIDRGEPVTFPTALLERTFLPWNKIYDDNFKIYKFLYDLIPSLGAPRSFHLPFYEFYRVIYNKIFKRDIKISEIFKLHRGIYDKIMRMPYFSKSDEVILYKNFSTTSSDFSISSEIIFEFFKRKRKRDIKLPCKLI
jgi:hypothetical protein